MMFYEHAVAVSAARHGDLCIETGVGYAFTSHTNAVPIMAQEFVPSAMEYAIVFAPVGEGVFPAAVLGLRADQNLYLDPAGTWRAKYVPAFIRRYPFVFSAGADRKTLTLCIDESHKGLNREGRGQRLFDEAREPTAFTRQMLKFLQDMQEHFQRTRHFCGRLKDLGILEPAGVEVTAAAGEKVSMGGFLVVNRKKLRELPDDKLLAMARSDELELLHLHLYSLRNFTGMKDRLMGAPPAEPEEAAASTTLQ